MFLYSDQKGQAETACHVNRLAQKNHSAATTNWAPVVLTTDHDRPIVIAAGCPGPGCRSPRPGPCSLRSGIPGSGFSRDFRDFVSPPIGGNDRGKTPVLKRSSMQKERNIKERTEKEI